MTTFDPITLEILWGRLVGIVDEAGAALVRTAFSTITRESGDYACVLLDAAGNALAQTTQGIPQLATVCPRTVRAMLKQFDPAELAPGDILFTNDPWLGAGHLPDFFTAMPIFRKGRIVAYAAAVCHVADTGGLLAPADARSVYEEGLCIPPLRLFHKGEPDQRILDIIQRNVRVSDQVIGDLNALVAADFRCGEELQRLMDDAELAEITPLACEVLNRSEQAMRSAIEGAPDGVYEIRVETDGHDHPNVIQCAIRIQGDSIKVDYEGTSPQLSRGINSVYNYTYGYTIYSLKCVLDPHTPMTEGSCRPIQVDVPVRSMLNPEFPAPVYARNQTGHYLPAVIMQALSQALPHQVMAASGTPMNRTVFAGPSGLDGRPFSFLMFTSGGMGAMQGQDGLSCAPFPSNAATPSIEVAENTVPITIWRKALRHDSGGPGQWRGGLGMELVIENSSGQTMNISTRMDRIQHPPEGLSGGLHGAPAGIWRNGKEYFPPKGRAELGAEEHLLIHTPGGGGFGSPEARTQAEVAEDLCEGYVTPQAALQAYGKGVAE